VPTALRHRDFRHFWTGAVLSGVGSQFTIVAMAWQIYELTDSPLQIGLLGLARAVPQMLLFALGGLLADAFDRRRLLIISQLAQFAVSGSLVIATAMGAVTPSVLFLASGCLALFTALETPPRQALVPSLVPPEDLGSALALNTTLRHVGTIVGPSLAGVLLALSGAAWCYAVDAVSWLAMLGAVLAIAARSPSAGGLQMMTLSALREALIFVRQHPIILWFMVLDFAATFFGSTRALLPIYARDVFAVGAAGLGWLYAAESVGSVVAAVVLSRLSLVRHTGRWVLLGVGLYGTCIVLFALSSSLVLSMLMLVGTGVGNTIGAVLRGTINQLSTPDQLRGRVAAVNSVFTQGGPQLGQFESGAVAEVWGTQISALSGGVATLLVVGALALMPSIRGFKLIPATDIARPAV
jgi:MFS family permease